MSLDTFHDAIERDRDTGPADTGEWIAQNREMLEDIANSELAIAPVIDRLLARYDRGEI